MAEAAVISAMVQAILQSPIEKAISVASQELSHFWGFKEDIERLKISFTMAQSFLSDADQRLLFRSIAFKTWLENLEAVAYEADNVLDEFNYELLRCKLEFGNQMKRKVISFFSLSNPMVFRIRMAYKVKGINTNLKLINEEANAYGLNFQTSSANLDGLLPSFGITISRETDSVSVHPKVVGREDDITKLVEMLLSPSDEVVSIIPILGMGGLGKTTLARVVYQDQKISNHFQEKIWVSASESFEVKKSLRLILESLTKQNDQLQSREAVVKRLQDLLASKRYLLVLDDMWNECSETWTDFISTLMGIGAAKGNCILVTTRKQQVASTVAGHPHICLRNLSTDDTWSIMKERAFAGREVLAEPELEAIGKKIANKCLGIPLVASVVGGMLRTKERDEWISVLEKGILDSSGDDNNVLRILKLSFDRLPSPTLKKCFAYCSIFPKDFEIERQQVIQLWMAEGFLQPNPGSNMAMEEIGDMFFNILLQNNLLQDVEKDVYNNILHCKMHDLVHDLAQSIAGSKIVNVENDQSDDEADDVAQARCLALHAFEQVPDEFWNEKARCLRTLFLKSNIPHKVLLSVQNLHVLNLSGAELQELPISIGKLIHLRYLDLSKTEIKSLPNSLSILHHLQTLRARKCPYLYELPDGMKNMISLRHLCYKNYNEDFQMPLNMGQLTCLQTLQFFNVGKEKGRKIEELGFLQNLRGKLEIRNLQHVCNKEEAQRADLYGKPSIYKLSFHWSNDRYSDNNEENVLEGFEPHPNLKSLTVQNFMSNKFPPWIMRMAVDIDSRGGLSKKLENLVKIQFIGCRRLEEIPTLGILPSVQYLKLEGLDNVVRIGASFYGIDDSGGSSSHNSGAPKVLFPKLKFLSLENMPNLKEWTEFDVTPEAGSVVVFPILEELTIENCCQLITAPSHFPSLKRLNISSLDHGSSVIAKLCSKVITLTSLSIMNARELAFLPDWLPHKNPNLTDLDLICCPDLTDIVPETWGSGSCLKSLQIHDCKMLSKLPNDFHALQSLASIDIYGCHNLRSFPIPCSTHRLSSLRILKIVNCDNLIHLPSEMLESVRSLESLTVHNCRKLTSITKGLGCLPSLRVLGIGPFADRMEFNQLVDFFDGLQQLSSSLYELNLYGLPQWHSLPDQLQHLSALKKFYLSNFGLEVLPDWFENLSSLEHLSLCNCAKLQYLPSMEAMRHLSKLQRLDIYDCPLLKGRCNQRSTLDSEWSKICHIPKVWIDEVRIK